MGGEMTEVDCTVFAQMVNIFYNYKRSPYHAMLTGETVKQIHTYIHTLMLTYLCMNLCMYYDVAIY